MDITERVLQLHTLVHREVFNKEDIISLLTTESVEEKQFLFREAVRVRDEYCGAKVHLRGIIEISNHCIQNCLYCGLRKSNTVLPRYRMTRDEIIKTAGVIHSQGIKTIVLQSGEDYHYTGTMIADIIRQIKQEFDCAITLSLGERPFSDYEMWFSAGADRYLLKHETANNDIYRRLHTNQNLDERIRHLEYLKLIGFQAGSGNIIGLPGQTIEDIADDILLCRDLDVDMASFSPFLPSSNTPLADHTPCSVDLTLLTMAIARIVLRNAHIPATSALATLDEQGREKGIMAGANVVMPSYTPSPYRTKYNIYNNKICITENPEGCLPCLKMRILSTGVSIAEDYGHSLKKISLRV